MKENQEWVERFEKLANTFGNISESSNSFYMDGDVANWESVQVFIQQEINKAVLEERERTLRDFLDDAIFSGDDNIGIRTIGLPTELFEKLRDELENY
jgi:hypothetical protein